MSQIITIGGGTGSGKSTLADALAKKVNGVVIRVDDYYRPLDHLTFDERAEVNFDAPSAIDHVLLIEQVHQLHRGLEIEHPIYDFSRHTRAVFGRRVQATGTVIVEGLFALYWPELCELATIRIFVQTKLETRFRRRLHRDIEERGRDQAEVTRRFNEHVNPMHDKYVEPTLARADLVVSGDRDLEAGVRQVLLRAAPNHAGLLI